MALETGNWKLETVFMHVLREYRHEDFETLYRIDQECFDAELAYSRAELNHYLLRKAAFAIVAEDKKGNVAGFIVAETDKRGFGHIITIDVLPTAWRTGLGSKLLATVEQRIRTAGCRLVLLEVAIDNVTAIQFYKRLNYAIDKVIPHYYNDGRDAFLMIK